MSNKNRLVHYRLPTKQYVVEEVIQSGEDYEVVQTPLTALLHFDESPTKDKCGNTWTTVGSPTISETNAKFGKALYWSKAVGAYIESDFVLGGQDFTIDCWEYINGYRAECFNITGVSTVDGSALPDRACSGWLAADGEIKFGGYNNYYTGVPTKQLHHLAVVYTNSDKKIRYFINGVLKQSYILNGQFSKKCNCHMRMGGYQYSGMNTSAAGYFDELRITDGIALWTENFTPPTQPYTVVQVEDSSTVQDIKFYSVPTEKPRVVLNGANHTKTYAALVPETTTKIETIESPTVVLMHFDDSDFPYFDESCGKSWIAYNSPTISEEHARFGKAIQFNGTNQMIACGQGNSWPDITRFDFGEKDFTIDFWAYIDSTGGTGGVLMSFCNNGTFSYPQLIIARSDSKLCVMNQCTRSSFTAERIIYSTSDVLDKLIHVALVYRYSDKILSLYIDGKKEAEMENAAVSRGSNCKYHTEIGALGINSAGSNTRFFKGFIDELRITDGVARWTENFTPPTEPHLEKLLFVDTGKIIDNPIASDINVRFGTGEDDVKRLAKCKHTPILVLSETSIVLSAGKLSDKFTFATNSDGEVIVTSNKPDIVSVSQNGNVITVTAVGDSGSAIISVQIAESSNFEGSQVATCAVGNYIFGALNTCTPNEIQVAARLGIANTTWAVGDFTADFAVEKFTVGGAGSRYWATGSGAWKIKYSQISSGKDEHVRGRIIGFNHNANLEGNNTIHFMMDNYGYTAPMAVVDTKNYNIARNYSAAYSGTVSASSNGSTYNYTFTHHGGGSTSSNKKGWTDSVIRTKLLPAFLNAMPSEWTSVMASCTKYTYHPESSTVTSVTDKLFILSEYEIIGSYAETAGKAHSEEYAYQAKYSLSAFMGASRKGVNYLESNDSTTYAWALRSPCADNTTQYCAVPEGYLGHADDITGIGARVSLGVAPCFVIA